MEHGLGAEGYGRHQPTRLRVVNFNIVTAVEADNEDAEAQNYVLLSLPRDSVYFDWKYKQEKAFANVVRVERTQARTLIDLTISVEQAGRTREFVLSLPYGWFQSAHMFSLHQNSSPLFLVRSEDDAFEAELVHDLDAFDFYISAIELESGLTERLVNVFQEVVADRAIYNLSPKEYDTVRGDALSLALALSRGSMGALERVVDFGRRYDAVRHKIADKDYEPTLEEKQMLFTRLHVARMLNFGHPAQFAARGESFEQVQAERQTIDEFEQIMQQNDLADAFSELVDAYEAPVGPNASDDQKMTYFASSTTHLPAVMEIFLPRLLGLNAFERNWNSDSSEVDVDDLLPDGDSLIVGFIVVALRIARRRELVFSPEEEFHPSFFLQTALSMEGEPPFWAYQQAHRLLGAGDVFTFEDFLLSQLPRELPEGIPQEMLLSTPAGNALHNLGHLILKDEVGRPALRHAFEQLPIIASFLEDVYEQDALLKNQQEEIEGHSCAAVLATLGTLQLDFNRRETIEQLGRGYLALAELNALRNTEHVQGSAEWSQWLQEYLYEVSD